MYLTIISYLQVTGWPIVVVVRLWLWQQMTSCRKRCFKQFVIAVDDYSQHFSNKVSMTLTNISLMSCNFRHFT